MSEDYVILEKAYYNYWYIWYLKSCFWVPRLSQKIGFKRTMVHFQILSTIQALGTIPHPSLFTITICLSILDSPIFGALAHQNFITVNYLCFGPFVMTRVVWGPHSHLLCVYSLSKKNYTHVLILILSCILKTCTCK